MRAIKTQKLAKIAQNLTVFSKNLAKSGVIWAKIARNSAKFGQKREENRLK